MQSRIKDEKITALADKIERQTDQIQLISKQLQGEKVKIEKQKQELEWQSKIKALQDKIDTQDGEIQQIRNPLFVVPTPTEETPKIPYSFMEHALFGLGFGVLGVLIALVTKAGLRRCTPTSDQHEMNERLLRCPCVSLQISYGLKT